MNRVVATIWGLHSAAALTTSVALGATAADVVWQWSVPVGEGRAYLWIPEHCAQVRAVVLAQHNMIERGILQDGAFRRALAGLDMAEVFIMPSIDVVFRFDQGAGGRFDGILRALADESGYGELARAPVVPIGHSAHASFPWNFAAWDPGRTLAVMSLKGDAPLTDLTGSGRPNPDWGTRTIDGVPALFVMSEYEWWEARLDPLLRYRVAHPAAPIALLVDAGHGHFDATRELIDFLALFLRKAAAARLPSGGATALRAVDPEHGWLIDRWRADEPPRAGAAPHRNYTGDRTEASWCADEEMARLSEAYHATSRGKKVQQVSFVQEGALVPISNSHGGIGLKFLPEADGLTIRLAADFITPLPSPPRVATKDKHPTLTVVQPVLATPGTHAAGPVRVSMISGPLEETAPGTFKVAFDRMFSPADPRASEVWLLASHPGDAEYKSAVQQALLRLPRFTEGGEQVITFPEIGDRRLGSGPVALAAASDSGLPTGYFVREGPAMVQDGMLRFTTVPPRARLPIKFTVVAWQAGRGGDSPVRAATPVERSSFLVR